ncbi:MAG: hypothetical protein OEV42_21115 [Deltaproteobacteria bacterium]|nr:hypothetical protein [Deltaproteobacteria bacterium]
MKIISFIVLFIVISGSSQNVLGIERDKLIEIKPFNANNIKVALTKYNSQEILNYIFSNSNRSKQLIHGIRSGKDAWLLLFVEMYKVSDAGWSEILDSSIGYSLVSNPRGSLKTMREVDNILSKLRDKYNLHSYAQQVCDNVDEMWDENEVSNVELAGSALIEINKRIKALTDVNNESLERVKSKCLEALYNSKKFWEDYSRK